MIMNDIISTIRKSSKIGISFHVSPDGDALGSALALMLGLKKININSYIICKDEIPEAYKFLPSAIESIGQYKSPAEGTDCIIVLDCGNLERISAEFSVENIKHPVINIDHHLSNDLYGSLNYVDTNAAAAGEIIYQMMKIMGVSIDKDMAVCLYTSLLTDTGGFRHSNTTAVTHAIAGDLINTGINFSDIYRILFENKKYKRIKLYGKVIESMELVNNICFMYLKKDMLSDLGIEASDTSDIISLGLTSEEVEVAALIKEFDSGAKVSLRSKSIIDVRKIAELYGGGGHIRASGFTINDKSFDEIKQFIVKAVEKELI